MSYFVGASAYHLDDLLYAESQLDVNRLSGVKDWDGERIVASRVQQLIEQPILVGIRQARYKHQQAEFPSNATYATYATQRT